MNNQTGPNFGFKEETEYTSSNTGGNWLGITEVKGPFHFDWCGDGIQISFIAPVNHLNLTRYGHQHFILAHLVPKFEEYAKFYCVEHKWKILDNGAYELAGLSVPNLQLVQAAERVEADEVILPDAMWSRPDTFDHSLKFLEEFGNLASTRYNPQFMFIPQGKTVEEWIQSYLEDGAFFLGEFSSVKSIGFPIWLDRFARRESVINYVSRKYGLHKCEHHLLGIDDYSELLNYPPGLIRSADSSRALTLAVNGVTVQESLLTKETYNQQQRYIDLDNLDRITLSGDETLNDPSIRRLAIGNIRTVMNWVRMQKK